MSYELHAIFSVLRVTLGFFLVFGLITPLFFHYAGTKKGIDRIVFSWVGLGGLIILTIFILVTLHIYDFISIMFCLLMIPFLIHFFKRKWEGETIMDIFNTGEHQIIAIHISFIEKLQKTSFRQIKNKILRKPTFKLSKSYTTAAVLVGVLASIIRIIPAIQNSAPFTRMWYFELDAVKGLSLQQYFNGYPSPKGMHSMVHFFSTITQVSPEMILHIVGGLISFFLCIIIFWVVRDLTAGQHPAAALLAAIIYAVFSTIFLPISLQLETELTSLSFALCFALPTIVLFLRNIRSGGKVPWFYIFMGIIATGFSDIFVFLMVLTPSLLVGLITLPKTNFIRRFGKLTIHLLAVYIFTLAPFLIYSMLNGIELSTFFQDQLFNTQSFNFAPYLVLPIDELSTLFLILGSVLLVAYLVRALIKKKKLLGAKVVFLLLFIAVSFVFTPYFDYQYVLIDPDQLNGFYAILICVFFGLSLYFLLTVIDSLGNRMKKITPYLGPIITASMASWFFWLQGGVEVSSELPKTEPNGFFDAYYSIIRERVPYTYATVGPELDRDLAKNRHYFMSYSFFLDNYGVIDSLYQKYLTAPADQYPKVQEVPPASIFLFLEKPPYGNIQQGILYNAQGIMRDMKQWLASFQELEGRTVEIFHETNETVIYEIINREGESTITGILRNVYPKEKGRAARFFK